LSYKHRGAYRGTQRRRGGALRLGHIFTIFNTKFKSRGRGEGCYAPLDMPCKHISMYRKIRQEIFWNGNASCRSWSRRKWKEKKDGKKRPYMTLLESINRWHQFELHQFIYFISHYFYSNPIYNGCPRENGPSAFLKSLLFIELDQINFYTKRFPVQFSTKHVLPVLLQNSKVHNAFTNCEKY
jgi:hypothetical protein